MTCSWCNGSISILRGLTDSHYCCDEHRDYAKMSALHGEEVQRNDARRRHRRYAVDGAVLEVSWLDVSGRMQSTRSRVLNISEDGIALQLPDEVMPLRVRFRCDRLKIEGVGAVRQCRRTGAKYLVGLEFTDGLHWRAPESDIQEPVPLCEPGI